MAVEVPDDRRYSKEHEWARAEDGKVTVGITDFAQDQLGDVVFVQLPEAGASVTAGEPFGEVESTKSVSDVYSPISGTVAEKNSAVEDNPELINSDPYGAGWLISIEAEGDLDELMTAAEYTKMVEDS